MENSNVKSESFKVKRILLIAFVFMTFGTLFELYLLDHYEDTLQLIPMICIGVSMSILLILFFKRSTVVMKLFKFILILTSLSGIYGAYLHLNANYEFELEMKPSANNWDLLLESFSGAFPALAPLSMIVMALIGYSYLILINQKR